MHGGEEEFFTDFRFYPGSDLSGEFLTLVSLAKTWRAAIMPRARFLCGYCMDGVHRVIRRSMDIDSEFERCRSCTALQKRVRGVNCCCNYWIWHF
jgi:hypothetical protein